MLQSAVSHQQDVAQRSQDPILQYDSCQLGDLLVTNSFLTNRLILKRTNDKKKQTTDYIQNTNL